MQNKFIATILLALEAAKYYFLLLVFVPLRRKDVWLLAENGIMARDNGYAFYKYLKEKHPEICVKYVISSNSKDAKKILAEDRIEPKSIEHYKYFIKSKILISSHLMGYSPDQRLYNRLNKYGILFNRTPKVFLQHGIIKDFIGKIGPDETKLSVFVCSAERELEYIAKTSEYKGSERKILKLTGMPRYDYLNTNRKKIIALIPTWRKEHRYMSSIKGTDYYRSIMQLINNANLQSALEKNGYVLYFYPHIETQSFLSEFKTNNKNVKIVSADDMDVHELITTASVMVTDYSSIAFDFAYQKTPLIYFQFDKEYFEHKHYRAGYFKYEDDGFGDVLVEPDRVVAKICNYIKNPIMEEKYSKRVDAFYAHRDRNNSDRVYAEIQKTIGEKNEE